MSKQKIIIAGPCAAESRNQVINSATELKKRKIKIMRASLWKPRTKPGFEGVGRKGIPWLAEVTKLGLTVATEVLLADHVSQLIFGINQHKGDASKLLFWLGSRNQNHLTQREIAKRVLKEAPKNTRLLIKNQPWEDEKHWLGIMEHVLGVGFPSKRLILCHRGFAPNNEKNPLGYRNPPNFELAIKIKKQTGLPILLDPSHIGGSVANVIQVVKASLNYDFDGLMIEVHPLPRQAITDNKQQLSFEELDKLLSHY